jgi:hypothetical protein
MMPILYLLGGAAQLVMAVAIGAVALADWRQDMVSTLAGLIIAALFSLCAFLLLIQVQP